MSRKAKKDIDLEDMMDDQPPAIEPYKVLGLEKSATPDAIKAAYRKAALRHHPDKATEDKKDEAHVKFQEVAFAYAVLSDPIRRKRYDATGSTAESIDADDNFSWSEFFSQQFKDVVTSGAIEAFAKQYQNSVEEKDDVLAAYDGYKGNWKGIYETVMLSNCLKDEDRFRAYINEAIEKGEVKAHKKYTDETERAKELRFKAAREEGQEAEEHAKELGIHDQLFGKKGAAKAEDALKALIQKKNAAKGASFFDHLEAKYGGGEKNSKGKKGKRGSEDLDDEPSEEAFQAAAKRLKRGKASEATEPKKSKKSKA